MLRLFIASLITSTGLMVSAVDAGDYASEQLEMMRDNQFESLSTSGSTSTFGNGASSGSTTTFSNGPSSPAMFTPSSPNMGSNMLQAPEPPKPISICWVVDQETICVGE